MRIDRLVKWALKGGIANWIFIVSDYLFEELQLRVSNKKITNTPKATLKSSGLI